MNYPGNSALSPEIQQRILDTFQQTVELAEHGSAQEAILGCDFILRLDPSFEPARILKGRLEGTGDMAVDVDDIKAAVPDLFGEAASQEPLVENIEDTVVGELATQESGVKGDIQAAFEQRDFQRTLALIDEHHRELGSDDEIRTLRSEASSRLEAEPYVKNFIDQARVALQDGDGERAAQWIEKAKALDPSHPGLAEMETVQGFYETPEHQLGYRRGSGAQSPEETPEEEDSSAAEGSDSGSESESAPEGESAQRIAELLAEGQASFDERDYQGAIDIWSRIFLIDIDHQEATRRIEEARQLKAEGEREIEEIFHDGLSRADQGDLEGARAAFEKVLEMQPQHVAARDQLKHLEEKKQAAPTAAPQVAAQADEPAEGEFLPGVEDAIYPAGLDLPGGEDGREGMEDLLPGQAPRASRRPGAFVWIGGLVLLIVLVGGWFLYSQRQTFFPNAKQNVVQKQAPSFGAIGRAKRLHANDKVDLAIQLLQGIPPDSPDYAQAQTLIAQWQAPATDGSKASEDDLSRRDSLITQAKTAHAQGDDLQAGKLIDQAAAIAPLVGDADTLAKAIHENLAPVEKQLELFQNNDWEYALPDLWRKHEANPKDRVVNQLLVDGYYNLAIRDLQRNSPASAVEKVQEALNLAPSDPELQRVKAFAETYEHQPRDLRYRLFVKYLPFR